MRRYLKCERQHEHHGSLPLEGGPLSRAFAQSSRLGVGSDSHRSNEEEKFPFEV